MKKSVLALLGILLFTLPVCAQGDIPTTRPLKIGDNNKLDVKTSNQGTLLRMPSVLDESLTSKNEKPGVQMLPDRELLQAGHDMVIDPKVKEKKEKGSNEYFGDQYLGDFTTKAGGGHNQPFAVLLQKMFIDAGPGENPTSSHAA